MCVHVSAGKAAAPTTPVICIPGRAGHGARGDRVIAFSTVFNNSAPRRESQATDLARRRRGAGLRVNTAQLSGSDLLGQAGEKLGCVSAVQCEGRLPPPGHGHRRIVSAGRRRRPGGAGGRGPGRRGRATGMAGRVGGRRLRARAERRRRRIGRRWSPASARWHDGVSSNARDARSRQAPRVPHH
jgi:hypothetical protein